MTYDMRSFVEQCLEAYEELAGTNLQPYRNVDTPFIDETTAIPYDEEDKKGVLAPVAQHILMKVLYAARLGRYDILRAT